MPTARLPSINGAARDVGAFRQEFPPVGDPELIEALAGLRREREQQGLSLTDIADRTGIDRATISKLETGKIANPTISTLQDLCPGPWTEARMDPRIGRQRGIVSPGLHPRLEQQGIERNVAKYCRSLGKLTRLSLARWHILLHELAMSPLFPGKCSPSQWAGGGTTDSRGSICVMCKRDTEMSRSAIFSGSSGRARPISTELRPTIASSGCMTS